MAEGRDSKQTGNGTETENMDEPERVKQCAICLEKFRRPKLLPCFHTFCQSCLQGLAGSSSSFPCPSCRTVVRLPPGGVAALKTNFYIEGEGLTTSVRLLCDACTDEREAAHSCLQCQQRYCLPCRQSHDSFTFSRGHAVIPLDAGEDEGSGEKNVTLEPVEMCPKHPDQRLFLHCSACQTDVCLHCKLTLHEGHHTEDLKDVRAKVKDKLKDKMEEFKVEMQQIDEIVSSLEERMGKIQSQKESLGESCHSRAAMLQDWVKMSLEETEKSLENSTQQKSKPWRELSDRLRDKKLALQAQLEHIACVLRGGRQRDIVSLDAQLSSGMEVEEGDVIKETLEKLTDDVPSLNIEHSLDTVNRQQLSAFIGVLESDKDAPNSECRSQCSGAKHSKAESTKVSEVKSKTNTAPLENSDWIWKKAPRELVYSRNPHAVLYHMCPISGGRLWVMYKWRNDVQMNRHLKLLDAEGQVLVTLEDFEHPCRGLVPLTDDNILASSGGKKHQLISPDGIVTPCKMTDWLYNLVCTSQGDLFQLELYENNSYVYGAPHNYVRIVTFLPSKSEDQTDNTHSAESQSQSVVASSSKPQLTLYQCYKAVGNYSVPDGRDARHVSATGEYFVWVNENKVEVYSFPRSRYRLVCCYETKKMPIDARFCTINGREMLLVIVNEDDNIHLVELSEGGYCLGDLNTEPLKLNTPCRLAVDSKHVWIGCMGGKVVMLDL